MRKIQDKEKTLFDEMLLIHGSTYNSHILTYTSFSTKVFAELLVLLSRLYSMRFFLIYLFQFLSLCIPIRKKSKELIDTKYVM